MTFEQKKPEASANFEAEHGGLSEYPPAGSLNRTRIGAAESAWVDLLHQFPDALSKHEEDTGYITFRPLPDGTLNIVLRGERVDG